MPRVCMHGEVHTAICFLCFFENLRLKECALTALFLNMNINFAEPCLKGLCP